MRIYMPRIWQLESQAEIVGSENGSETARCQRMGSKEGTGQANDASPALKSGKLSKSMGDSALTGSRSKGKLLLLFYVIILIWVESASHILRQKKRKPIKVKS